MPRQIDLELHQAESLIHHFTPTLRMVRLLGAGSFGQVFLLEDDLTPVAVKIIPLELAPSADGTPAKEEINHEWHQLTTNWDRLNHASLVRIRQFFHYVDPDPKGSVVKYGLIYMDYWPIDLFDFIGHLVAEGRHTAARKRALLFNLARLLWRLLEDAGLIVTDLKLENVMVRSEGDGPLSLALIDLGGICEARLADYYRVISTDFYMAPELYDHSINMIDEAILIYSFGLIGFYILEGRWPVEKFDYLQPMLPLLRKQGGMNWSDALRADMAGCVAIIERCVAEDRQKRYPNLAALVEALQTEGAAAQEAERARLVHKIEAFGYPQPVPRKSDYTAWWRDPGTGMEFVWIPSGRFDMGQSPAETRVLRQSVDEEGFEIWYARELPRHGVFVDGFWMGRYPVTRGQFAQFVEETLYLTDRERLLFAVQSNTQLKQSTGWSSWKKTRFQQEDNHPVVHISWFDAKRFAEWMSVRTRLRFAIPTEAQWEYACHGGGSTPFHFGHEINTDQANYDGEEVYGAGKPGLYRKSTTACGLFTANRYGLYDMHGNVWEWCEDKYDGQFYQTPAARQRNPVNRTAISYRIKRGGSWRSPPALLRAAYRGGGYPDLGKEDIGFRLILTGGGTGG